MKQAINTKTQEEYDALMKHLVDEKQFSHPLAPELWGLYKKNTCVNVEYPTINYSPKSFYETLGYTIIPYTEFAKANIVEEAICKNCNKPESEHSKIAELCPDKFAHFSPIQEADYKALYLEGRELLEKCANISPDFQDDYELLNEVREYLKNGNEKTI